MTEQPAINTPWRAAMSALLGSALEYYDFFVYGTASALVINKVFFPIGNPTVAMISSLATFGIGYLARPIGAFVFGHFGDRIGRKRILLLTLTLMGIATIAIAALPTYSQIGIAAPVLLVICRLVQGFSAGGEVAGATALTLESAPGQRRGFFTSFTLVGYSVAIVVSSLIFLPLTALPESIFLTWAWRIPFVLGAVVLIIAYTLRRRLSETASFEDLREHSAILSVPSLAVLKTHLPAVTRVVFASLFAASQTMITVFGLSFATSPEVGMSRTTILVITSTAMAGTIVLIPVFGRVSDAYGRRPVWLIGTWGAAASTFGYFWAISTAAPWLVFLMSLVNMTLFTSMINSVWTVLFAEMFPTKVRFSGVAIGTQIGFVMAGFGPAIGSSLVSGDHRLWLPAACVGAGCAVAAGIAGISGRETSRIPTNRLGDAHFTGAPTEFHTTPPLAKRK